MTTQNRGSLSVLLLVFVGALVLGTTTIVVTNKVGIQEQQTQQKEVNLEADTTDEIVAAERGAAPEAVESRSNNPEPSFPPEMRGQAAPSGHTVITLAGGCFWCIEAYFQEEEGIVDAVSGYAGGTAANATYNKVSRGSTLHREAVQVTYNPNVVSTEEVLDIFWSHIDPVDTEGQFADKGFQYTTAIYYHDASQKMIAEDSKTRLTQSSLFDESIATEILPFTTFYEAEAYHQDYYKKASEHYERYKKASGRAGFVEETWAKDAALLFLEGNHNSTMNTDDAEVLDAYEHTEEELKVKRNALDLDTYKIVVEDGTERPYKNEYWDNKEDGIYVDVVSGEPLFSSTHKYVSGTGWPSFTQPIDTRYIVEKEDTKLFMSRTEVRSRHGDSHLGHVFGDGPEPTGQRYCMNSASLRFVPKEDMEKEGYGEYLGLFDGE